MKGMGTYAFMAPELFEEDDDGVPLHKPTPVADVFAFGVTAWCDPASVPADGRGRQAVRP